MKNKLLILLLGSSCVGKDTMAKQLSADLNVPIAVSCTTRPMRTGETNGVEYHFLSNDEFDDMDENNQFVEQTEYIIESENVKYRYGYSIEELDKSEISLAIVNPHGYRCLLESQFKDNILSIQIVRNDRDRLISYLERDKNVNIYEVFDRYKRDMEDFHDLVTDRIIYNDNYIESYTKLVNIIKEEIEITNGL